MTPKVREPHPDHLRFLAAYDPAIVELALATRAFVLRDAPDAIELIYDAYSAVSAGYGFTGRPSDSFAYVAAYGKRVNLGFYWGALLEDPQHLLQGNGNQSRHIPINQLSDLKPAYVRAFVKQAIRKAERPEPGAKMKIAPGTSLVRAVYERKRRPL